VTVGVYSVIGERSVLRASSPIIKYEERTTISAKDLSMGSCAVDSTEIRDLIEIDNLSASSLKNLPSLPVTLF
jgi:hypothetical protein